MATNQIIIRSSAMTDQEVFDFGYLAIVKQGKGSIDENGRCYYRHPNGIYRCVAGQFIPDHEYIPEMEQKDIVTGNFDFDREEDLVVQRVFEKLNINLQLISEMQRAHDFASKWAKENLGNFLDLWKHEMTLVGRGFHLSIDVIK